MNKYILLNRTLNFLKETTGYPFKYSHDEYQGCDYSIILYDRMVYNVKYFNCFINEDTDNIALSDRVANRKHVYMTPEEFIDKITRGEYEIR